LSSTEPAEASPVGSTRATRIWCSLREPRYGDLSRYQSRRRAELARVSPRSRSGHDDRRDGLLLPGKIGGKQEDSKNWLDWLIIGLLVFLAVRVYVERKETKPPKWMGRLEKATVGFAASIGFPLIFLRRI
jgi:hypothetical protein